MFGTSKNEVTFEYLMKNLFSVPCHTVGTMRPKLQDVYEDKSIDRSRKAYHFLLRNYVSDRLLTGKLDRIANLGHVSVVASLVEEYQGEPRKESLSEKVHKPPNNIDF